MTRRLGLAFATVAAIVACAACAEQSDSGESAVTSTTAAPVRSAEVASWVGPQVNPGLDASWAGPQINPGLSSSWVGVQVDPGLDSSWAGPQYTAAPSVAATTSSTLEAATSSVATTVAQSVPSSVPADFAPAPPDVAAAVTAAIGRTEAAYDVAVRDLSNPALRDALAATTVDGSAAELLFLSWYDHVVSSGYSVVAADAENSTTLMDGAVITVADGGHLAIARVCAASGDTILGPEASGTESVLASGWSAFEQVQIFILVNAAQSNWLLTDVIDLESHPGERTCGESSSSSAPSDSSPVP